MSKYKWALFPFSDMSPIIFSLNSLPECHESVFAYLFQLHSELCYNAESLSFLLWKGDPGQPQDLGRNFSMWMLLERTRFTLDGLECDKIGVDYEAFNGQPSFCSSPFWTCLHNQLWNYREVSIRNWKLVPFF